MVLGEELESERYLITIEEKLNPSSDHTHEVALKTQENEVERSVGPLYQPGKRKRRVCILTLCFVPVKTAFVVSVFIKFQCSFDLFKFFDVTLTNRLAPCKLLFPL